MGSGLLFLFSLVQIGPFSLLAAHAREGRSWGMGGAQKRRAGALTMGKLWGGIPDFLAVKRKSQGPEKSELC